MTPLDPTTAAMLAILFAGSVLLLLVLLAAPLEWAARRSARFANAIDDFTDRLFR